MHLIAATARGLDEAEEPVDLDQSPGEIVVLSAADTEISALTDARHGIGEDFPSLRLANWSLLQHPFAVDRYLEKTLSGARLVIVRLLGGTAYWPYGVERLRMLARGGDLRLALLPGEATWTDNLVGESDLPIEAAHRLWSYLNEGGSANYRNFLRCSAHLVRGTPAPDPPRPVPAFGIYADDDDAASFGGRAAIVVYKALVQSGQTRPVDALAEGLRGEGLGVRTLFASSLKNKDDADFIAAALDEWNADIVLNTTAFALSQPGAFAPTVLDAGRRPVLQVALSGASREAWAESSRGLSAKDLTMHVALPELDGRIFTRAVSFKEAGARDPLVEWRPVHPVPQANRIHFVARSVAGLVRLARKANADKRIAIVLSNYPTRDGRIGNGVGLDAPASTVRLIKALGQAGYDVTGAPATGEALMHRLLEGVTNSGIGGHHVSVRLPLEDYRALFAALPEAVREAVEARWGAPEDDPRVEEGAFALPLHRFGHMLLGIQPARGYNIDPKTTYHDPDLVPPHNYLAFYLYLRHRACVDALVHMGKHGNLEWLPGKALALSEDCFPEAVLGPVPVVYPFIVNDPGEGAQAKRRSQAVIVDHLMPPMTRAESHGGAVQLERLMDEFAEARGVDPRRARHLQDEIVSTAAAYGFDRDLGLDLADEGALFQLDAHLCDLKEMQIRDGLHVLGEAPEGRLRTDTLVALSRVPPAGQPDASLHRAIAADLGLAPFDPLACGMADPWEGPRPQRLAAMSQDAWRTAGDTVERIEALAAALVEEGAVPDAMSLTSKALLRLKETIAPRLDRSGEQEMAAVTDALAGRFVPPGPSGAPTRGRIDCLPTGRNFHGLDVRAVPTPAAWALGRVSAQNLAERHFRDEGEWPRAIALTAWGTSNMRTGGDDLAQALAFIGARPVWEPASGRVTGVEAMTLEELRRPRTDVTLRISGFFRDAFPTQIALFQQAVRLIAERDEPADANPIRAAVEDGRKALLADGLDAKRAQQRAHWRVFGAMPGAYGAGLQALIDEGGWHERRDLAEAFLVWGGYAYDAGVEGEGAREDFAGRLVRSDVVVHNQDNREHDLLDSDDYYQFQGGLAAAVETLSGKAPTIYHNDHARPEQPVVRRLEEELSRVVRGRAANPKWIAGVMRHGYKGAFEMAATVDYLFAYAATTNAVRDHHFDQLFESYLEDETVRNFIAENNRPALEEISARFAEAIDRGLWRPRRNSVHERLSRMARMGV